MSTRTGILPRLFGLRHRHDVDGLIARARQATKRIETFASRLEAGESVIGELQLAGTSDEELDAATCAREFNIQLLPGVTIRRICGASEKATILNVRAEEGALIPPHRHMNNDEIVIVIEGALWSIERRRRLSIEFPVEFVRAGALHGYRAEEPSDYLVIFRPPMAIVAAGGDNR